MNNNEAALADLAIAAMFAAVMVAISLGWI
jgi:hypothetical protein